MHEGATLSFEAKSQFGDRIQSIDWYMYTRLGHPIQDTLPKTDKCLSGSRTHVMEAIVYFQPSLLDLVTQLMHAHNQEKSLQLGAVKGPRETMVL